MVILVSKYLTTEIVSDISNLGFVSSNLISYSAKGYDKNSSDPKLILENLKLKNDPRLVIADLHINYISNKTDNSKLIIQGKAGILG